MAVIDLANPTRFLSLVQRVLPWLWGAALIVFIIGLMQTFNAPDDYQQGATVKIMYIHVPAAWLGMMGWSVMSVAALGTLVWRHPLADVAGKAAAPIGAAFTFICLITGALWGRPTWGTYWVWDARLTSMLVLLLLYLGVMAVGVLIVISGLALWKPVQFSELANLFGSFQNIRLVHFLCMTAIVAFIAVHVTLALLVPQSLLAMITGGPAIDSVRDEAPNAPIIAQIKTISEIETAPEIKTSH